MTKETFLYNSHSELIDDLAIAGRPLKDLVQEIQEIYLADSRPWIIGFSGGKDSTTVLSLIYFALLQLSPSKRKKHIYVVSSDTLVETPVVVDLIKDVLAMINKKAKSHSLPMSAHPVFPEPDQTFWVNLLGRGYPAPSSKFRWCTERMKIDPVSNFVKERVKNHGEVIVVLGSRSKESSTRAQVIAKHKIDGSSLGRHPSLPNSYSYMPIEEWDADEVWEYLMSAPCPWGGSNRQLFELYKGSNQGECPLVIDKSTPSCGNSRFGCWTCTVVTEDKAIHGLIESGDEWMTPLLHFRNELYQSAQPENAKEFRNDKRRSGRITFDKKDKEAEQAKHIRGPYWLSKRKQWVEKLLIIEKQLRDDGHDIELIQRTELQAIRQEWLKDPNEPDWEDSMPAIFKKVYPDEAIDWIENDAGAFSEPDMKLLKELEEKHNTPAELIMKLLEVELSKIGANKRHGIFQKLDSILEQDWDTFEVASKRHESFRKAGNSYDATLEQLQQEYTETTEVNI